MENAAYPVGTCAERVALGTAVVQVGVLPSLYQTSSFFQHSPRSRITIEIIMPQLQDTTTE